MVLTMKRSITATTARQREQAKGATAFDRLMAERTRAKAARRRRIAKKQERRQRRAAAVAAAIESGRFDRKLRAIAGGWMDRTTQVSIRKRLPSRSKCDRRLRPAAKPASKLIQAFPSETRANVLFVEPHGPPRVLWRIHGETEF
jgi:hypothetical protein